MKSQVTTKIISALLSLSVMIQPALAQTSSSPSVPLRFNVKNNKATVAVDGGVKQVVLEQKVGAGWKPISVAYPVAATWGNFGTRRVTLNVPAAVPTTDLRVNGYRNVKFPSRFLRGKRSFDRKDLNSGSNGGPIMMSSVGVLNSGTAVTDSRGTAAPVAVESDIWQIVGDQVYFFNQYRGLQILDLADPTLPVRAGSLRLPASGEQMFVLDTAGTQVALLGRSNDKARQGAATVWLIHVTDGVPSLVGEVPLTGAISDSRLIGNTLHVLCNVWSPGLNNQNWTSDNVLTSIDLSDLDAPQKLGSLSFPGYNAVLQAAEGHLLVGSQNRLHVVNVDAAPRLVKSLTTRGQIQDKFKMSIVNDAVVTVTIDWQNWANRQTWVETFPLAGSSITALSALELIGARGENLHATRFDGDRLYVVTFRNIDPLFIVDLADPAMPILSGVLEVPGWSTYLEPLGDKLLAVGVEDRHVTVSLFDVTDVTAPTLLSRLPLGPTDGYSWSEANYDEKAVEYLPEQGVVMVPFQTWNWGAGGNQKAIQVVNVGAQTLTAGATINHSFNPRRGSWIAGHFVTISGQELLVHSTDAATNSAPDVTLSLAWRTDRVVPFGSYLVQIEDGQQNWGGWYIRWAAASQQSATLRITPTSDPDALIETIDLGPGRVLGVTQKANQLYLAQWVPAADNNPQRLRTLVLDLSASPAVTELANVSHDLSGLNEYEMNLNALQPLWTSEQSLVWFVPMQQTYRWWWWGPVHTFEAPVLAISPGPLRAASNNVASSSLIAVNTTFTPAAITSVAAVLCPVSLGSTVTAGAAQLVRIKGSLRGTSSAFAEKGFIYFSYDTTVETPAPVATTKASSSLVLAISLPYFYSNQRVASWLQVIDWSIATPVLRDPVSIPGQLLSIAQADAQGAVILTNSDQQIATNAAASRVIQASAYDGVSAWQLDNYITSTSFGSPSSTDGTRIYLGREANAKGVVGIGYNAATGRLAQINTWTTTETPTMLDVTSGHLLASSYGNLEVASIAAVTGVLTPVASFETPTNLWLQVDRAAFTPNLDLWIPAADYGVEYLQRGSLAR